MNPFLEQKDTWEDFHINFMTHSQEFLNSKVGDDYIVKTAPMLLQLPSVEIERHPFIEIRDRRNRRVITVIEVLNPANKDPGADQATYQAKRAGLLASQTHFVEIDLRRGGQRPQPPLLPACDYYVLVSRAQDRPTVSVWPLRLRDRLPEIPIPLATPEEDVRLDLQEVLHRTYDAADYGKYIYGETPEPPLSPEDSAWAIPYAKEARRRS